MLQTINITDKAKDEFLRLRNLQPDTKSPLRFFVKEGGCSGMSYGIVFDEKRENDITLLFDTLEVVIDKISIIYIDGMNIDFSDELMGGGFKMINPNAKESCGCGTSFTT